MLETASTENGTPPLSRQLRAVAADIKLSHTVFALPFAVMATFLAAGWAGRRPGWDEFGLILLCMFFARTAAMAVNRFADAAIDARNPRTAGRAIPSGRVSAKVMGLAALLNALLLALSAAGFWLLRDNPWPLLLSPVVLVVLCGYSYTKRFTWLCHAILGLALGLSPLAAAIAIEPASLLDINRASCWGPTDWLPELWLLALMVLCWVAGFDVIYALQDVESDRAEGLHSMPASLGTAAALWISRGLHTGSAFLLIAICLISDQLGLFFALAAGLAIALLVLEHALVWGSKTHHLNLAFFTVNGVISLLLGAGGLADILLN